MNQRPPEPINGQHYTLTRSERAKRSPFMEAVKAEIAREDANDRVLTSWGIVLICAAMVVTLCVIGGFFLGRLM
ncbi:hypothetical protein JNB71_03640 [Rhizobium herbae]|uniref:Uncharacterized protein n=1 Tax=Rhizobium herbae TaxID=508661 RepID=A0ABS7H5Q6_9HYPH|nr:hypothetical protein [Rhizobium herbae]MBW9062404.1 hypothetical protein [Rhizobium herbae]